MAGKEGNFNKCGHYRKEKKESFGEHAIHRLEKVGKFRYQFLSGRQWETVFDTRLSMGKRKKSNETRTHVWEKQEDTSKLTA